MAPAVGCFSIFLLINGVLSISIPDVAKSLEGAVDFALKHPEEMNFDAILGFTVAQAQLLDSPPNHLTLKLINKIEQLRIDVMPNLPTTPTKMPILMHYLLRPKNWMTGTAFKNASLRNLGIYENWTVTRLLEDKVAQYRGVKSDTCLLEILIGDCYVSDFCHEMMLANRSDSGYLLSHRLLYLQVVRMKKCQYKADEYDSHVNDFCSLMLKEARTNQALAFPVHDLFIEQIMLCGIEGFIEFLPEFWLRKIISWQTSEGCFKMNNDRFSKRTSHVISNGCSDHTTGLAAAALSVNLKYKLL